MKDLFNSFGRLVTGYAKHIWIKHIFGEPVPVTDAELRADEWEAKYHSERSIGGREPK